MALGQWLGTVYVRLVKLFPSIFFGFFFQESVRDFFCFVVI